MSPSQSGKTVETAISTQPFATGFHGKCSVVGIGNEIAPGFHLAAELGENLPMSGTWRKKVNRLARPKILYKIQGLR